MHTSVPNLPKAQSKKPRQKVTENKYIKAKSSRHRAESMSGKIPLTTVEIQTINDKFLKRTNGLEFVSEIKQLSDITKEFRERYYQLYAKPSRKWFDRVSNGSNPFSKYLINADFQSIKNFAFATSLNETPSTYEFNIDKLEETSLSIGDLVLLKSNQHELAMCIDLPQSTKDPRYTFVKPDGSLIFNTSSSVLLRIPYDIPSKITSMSPLLQKESLSKYGNIGTIKNSSQETFLLPVLARQVITTPPLSAISKRAAEDLQLVLKKLQLLHRSLQNYLGSTLTSMVELVSLVEKLDLSVALSKENDTNQYIKDLIANNKIQLYGSDSSGLVIKASTLLSTYWGIQNQQESHMWGNILMNNAMLFPIAVNVYPISEYVYYSSILPKHVNNGTIERFSTQVNNGKLENIITAYPEIMEMLKQYAAGTFTYNSKITTMISSIFRNIKKYKNENTSRDICQDLYNELNPAEKINNSLVFNYDLSLPESSTISQRHQKLYELVAPKSIISNITNENRHDFGDMRVYCIDSPDAHEIDDGISIENIGNGKYTLYIHIADPASLFDLCQDVKQNILSDDILKTAFIKSFTTYLPDQVSPMLPKSYCKLADLGKNNNKTKTLSFSVDVITEPNKTIEIVDKSFKVRLALVSKFPENVTYQEVDSILKSETKRSPEVKKEIDEMYMIATLLNKRRIRNSAVIFGDGFNKGQVKLFNVKKNDTIDIKFNDQVNSESQLLVSEFMILANLLTGKFFHENKVPAIFKAYSELELGTTAKFEYETMRKNITNGKYPNVSDINKMGALLNSSLFTTKPNAHKMIGTSQYATVTSPLRRFPDMINHFQLHRIIRGLPLCFDSAELNGLIWHIQARDSILRKSSRQANSYWTLKYLQQQLEANPNKKFDVIVTSVPQNGIVRCVLPQFSAARGIIKLSPDATVHPSIGDTVKNCTVSKIACLDNILEFFST